jgi:ATP-dependent protease ClpP protease subunit
MKILSKLVLAIALLHLSPATADEVKLTTYNTVVIRGEVDGASMVKAQLELAKQVVRRGAKKYPIYLVLDSPGGSIAAGDMFIQFAKTIPNLSTISIFSASMASAIVQQLSGERLVTANGTLMFHQAYTGIEGTVETGSLETRLWYIKQMVLALEVANAKRMKMSVANYKELIVRELWLTAEMSKSFRAVDRQVDILCSIELINNLDTVVFNTFFGQLSVKFSGCPLFRAPVSVSSARIKYLLGAEAVAAKTSIQILK